MLETNESFDRQRPYSLSWLHFLGYAMFIVGIHITMYGRKQVSVVMI